MWVPSGPKDDHGSTKLDPIPVAQWMLRDSVIVHLCPVAAPEVQENPLPPAIPQLGVGAGDSGVIGERQIIDRIASDPYGPTLQRPAFTVRQDEPRHPTSLWDTTTEGP